MRRRRPGSSSAGSLNDPDPQVRLAALLALAELPASPSAAQALRLGASLAGGRRRRPLAARRGDRRRGAAHAEPSSRPSRRREFDRPRVASRCSRSSRGWPSTTPAAARPRRSAASWPSLEAWPTGSVADADRRRPRQGLAQGQGRDARRRRREGDRRGSWPGSPTRRRGQLVRLAARWGSQGPRGVRRRDRRRSSRPPSATRRQPEAGASRRRPAARRAPPGRPRGRLATRSP